VKLSDFGSSRFVGGADCTLSKQVSALTASARPCSVTAFLLCQRVLILLVLRPQVGTVAYLAPELLFIDGVAVRGARQVRACPCPPLAALLPLLL
jgi:serine/threonine protein kinase